MARETQVARRSQPQNAYDHEREGARTSGVTDLIVAALTTAPFGCNIAIQTNVGSGKRFRKWRGQTIRFRPDRGPAVNGSQPPHSAGATARVRSRSTPLTKSVIAVVATTMPSAMSAVVPSTRPKPPRLYKKAIAATAAPETTKLRK